MSLILLSPCTWFLTSIISPWMGIWARNSQTGICWQENLVVAGCFAACAWLQITLLYNTRRGSFARSFHTQALLPAVLKIACFGRGCCWRRSWLVVGVLRQCSYQRWWLSEWVTPGSTAIPGMTSLKDGDLQRSWSLRSVLFNPLWILDASGGHALFICLGSKRVT